MGERGEGSGRGLRVAGEVLKVKLQDEWAKAKRSDRVTGDCGLLKQNSRPSQCKI